MGFAPSEVARLPRACSNNIHAMHRHQHSYTVFASNIIIVRVVFAIAASIVVIIATIVIMLVFIIAFAGVARLQSPRSLVLPTVGDQSGHEGSRHGEKKAWMITVVLGMVMLVMAMVKLAVAHR